MWAGLSSFFSSGVGYDGELLELRRKLREYFPDHAGKGSLLSSYEAETGLLCMWAGLSSFFSSGVGYDGELLDCSKGVKDPWEIPAFNCD